MENRVSGRGSALYIEGWNRDEYSSERAVVEEIELKVARPQEG